LGEGFGGGRRVTLAEFWKRIRNRQGGPSLRGSGKGTGTQKEGIGLVPKMVK